MAVLRSLLNSLGQKWFVEYWNSWFTRGGSFTIGLYAGSFAVSRSHGYWMGYISFRVDITM